MVQIFPEALLHVYISSRGPQGYKVVWYNAFRYLDLKEGSDGAHLIASVKPEELVVRRLHFEYHSCGFLVLMRKVCSYNGGLIH